MTAYRRIDVPKSASAYLYAAEILANAPRLSKVPVSAHVYAEVGADGELVFWALPGHNGSDYEPFWAAKL